MEGHTFSEGQNWDSDARVWTPCIDLFPFCPATPLLISFSMNTFHRHSQLNSAEPLLGHGPGSPAACPHPLLQPWTQG